MSQLTNEETAKVFAMYLNDTAKVNTKDGAMHLVSVDIFHETVDVCESYDSVEPHYENIQDVKLLLRRLPSVSDEDKKEFIAITLPGDKIRNIVATAETLSFERKLTYQYSAGQYFWNTLFYHQYEYLKSKGYAVPLWFGIDHWANGKNAFELNIAIEKNS